MQTAMAAALTNAGFNTDETRLFNVVHDLIKQHKTADAVTARAVDTVRRDTGLLTAIVRAYVEQRIADREGISLKGEASGLGQNADNGRISLAARTVEGEGGQLPRASSQHPTAPSPSSEHDGKGQRNGADGHSRTARPVVPIPAAPSNLVPVQGHLRGKPARERTMEERQAIRGAFSTVNQSILDTYRLSSGELLADLRFGQLAAREAVSMKDAIVIRLVRQHCVAPPEVKVRDAIKAEQLKIFIDQAYDQTKEIAHAS